nr:MAG TPA: large terminase [Bacteriophage sp.]
MHAIIYRRVGNTLRESVYEQIIWAIDMLGLHEQFQYRVSPLEIRYKETGQRIIFRGADDPMKSKSIKISFGYFGILWFEELAEFAGMDDIRTIKASIIRGGDHSYTFYSYNPPQTARNWVNKEALIPKATRLVHHSTYLGAPPEWLGKEFIAEAEALRKANERAYRHMYLGEVTGTGGQVFTNLVIRAIPDDELDRYGRRYNGLDFGFAVDPDAYVRWTYDARLRKILAVDEFYGSGNSMSRLSGEVGKRAGRDVIRCDSADPRMISELCSSGVLAIGVKKGAGSVEHGMRWLQSLAEIVIDPKRTPNIAKEFSAYEYETDKNGDFLPSYPDRDNHTIDATRYSLEEEMAKGIVKAVRRLR